MEMLLNNVDLVLLVLFFVIILGGIRIAHDNERFVVSAIGRYIGIKGPGLLYKWPNPSIDWVRVSLNDSGQYLGDGLATVNEAVFPVDFSESLNTGDAVRISSFASNNIAIVKE